MDLENTWKQKYHDLSETVILSNHMMFPMIGLVSGAKWRTLDPQMRADLSELMRQHFDRIAASYVDAEIHYATELRNAGVDVREVGPEFFGEALREWEATWQTKAPVLLRLRRVAAGHAPGSDEAAR
jgi:TRAP-type C4-dicarboxylate transport system substrate-binding protein